MRVTCFNLIAHYIFKTTELVASLQKLLKLHELEVLLQIQYIFLSSILTVSDS